MFTKIKDWIKSNIISLGIIAALIIFIFIRENIHLQNETNRVDTTLSPVSIYKDYLGLNHAQINTQVVTSKQEFKEATKELKKGIKGTVKIDGVVHYTQRIDTIFTNLIIHDTVTIEGDSILKFSRIDNYLQAEAIANITKKTGSIYVSLRDTITHVDLLQRHFFRRNERKIDLQNKNPYSRIEYGNSIVLKDARPILDFAIFAGVNPFNQKPVFGIGAGIHLFSIKLR